MKTQKCIDYHRVAKAIAYIQAHFKEQPTLDIIADHVHLSPYHFQKLFTQWAGVSPKKFLQFISVQHAKQLLSHSQTSLFDASYDTGLSGTSRLHDLFVKIEGMTPGEYKNKGENLFINYSYQESFFGTLFIASTDKGVCYMGFSEQEGDCLLEVKKQFPYAHFEQKTDSIQHNALKIYHEDWHHIDKIKLHLKGTAFQLKVWETLLKIPMGNLVSYGDIAQKINHPKAARAVGTAVGSNPISFIIPCHRVIQSSGMLGGYMWGTTRKSAIIGWEAAQLSQEK